MTTWFLDVDGVVNVLPAPGSHEPHGAGWARWNTVRVGLFSITYSPDLVEAINDLSRTVTVTWLTTWRADAATFLAPRLGLAEFGFADADGDSSPWSASWWKSQTVIDHLGATNEATIWTDDDIGECPGDAVETEAERAGTPLLVLRPVPEHGLEPVHIERIGEFARVHGADDDPRGSRTPHET